MGGGCGLGGSALRGYHVGIPSGWGGLASISYLETSFPEDGSGRVSDQRGFSGGDGGERGGEKAGAGCVEGGQRLGIHRAVTGVACVGVSQGGKSVGIGWQAGSDAGGETLAGAAQDVVWIHHRDDTLGRFVR